MNSYKNVSVLVVGEYMWPWYQEACAKSLEEIGCRVIRFGWIEKFRNWVPGSSEPQYKSIFHRLQYALRRGPLVNAINNRLIEVVKAERPDVVWFYNVQHITAGTVRKLRSLLPDAAFCQYANDNPFSTKTRKNPWEHYLESIPLFDKHFAYRENDIDEYISRGQRDVRLLRSYFVPAEDYPVSAALIPAKYRCDVVFAGHYEDDGRIELLEAICRAGYSLNLYGGGWDAALSRLSADSPLRAKYPIMPATKEKYRYAICGAKVALCFLSTLNKDSYTRRNFQIPAMRTAMLSQYTKDLTDLYVPDVEACFFKSGEEMMEKLDKLLSDDEKRKALARSGFEKVYASGHDVTHRMRQFLASVCAETADLDRDSQDRS